VILALKTFLDSWADDDDFRENLFEWKLVPKITRLTSASDIPPPPLVETLRNYIKNQNSPSFSKM
jgi:hypothetical protein